MVITLTLTRRVTFKGGAPDWRSDVEMGLCEVRVFRSDDPASSASDAEEPEEEEAAPVQRSATAWVPSHVRRRRAAEAVAARLAAAETIQRAYRVYLEAGERCMDCGERSESVGLWGASWSDWRARPRWLRGWSHSTKDIRRATSVLTSYDDVERCNS